MHASVAVLPDPAMTYWLGDSSSRARSLTGEHPGDVADAERCRLLRGDAGSQVAGVDDPAPLGHLETPTRDARDHRAVADVFAVGEELDASRLHHLVEHPRVVDADLRLGGPLLQALLGPALLQLPPAEQGRRNAIEGGGLMQSDEGVRLEPVSADAVPTVDQRHPNPGVVGQCVGEGHSHCTGTHHEVVGLDRRRHASTVALPPRRVHTSARAQTTVTGAEPLRPSDDRGQVPDLRLPVARLELIGVRLIAAYEQHSLRAEVPGGAGLGVS